MVNVVHIGTADNSGGAARAAFRLHQGLLDLSVHSSMLVGKKVEDRKEIDVIPSRAGFVGDLTYRLVHRLERTTGLQYLLTPWKKQFLTHPFTQNADIINFHNLHGGFFSHTILPALSRRTPLVWTLHDMWSLTGHCSYPDLYECDKWKTGCGGCPALHDYPSIQVDTTAYLWKKKKNLYQESNLTLVAPSKWLARVAEQSPLFQGVKVHHIPYGADLKVFQPWPKKEARQNLKIPTDKKILLFSAFVLNSERKGWTYFVEALKQLKAHWSQFEIYLVGQGSVAELEKLQGLSYTLVPHVDEPTMLVQYYSAADVCVVPSLADNLPLVVMESLACGTPVVGFDVGGVPDMVQTGKTGYLAKFKDAADLAKGILTLLQDGPSTENQGAAGRALMEQEFSIPRQAERYLSLYERLLSQTKK